MDRVKLYYFSIFLLVISCQQKNLDQTESIIQEIKNKYAPDNRTAIFEITASSSNPVILEGESNLKVAKYELLRLLDSLNIKYTDYVTSLPEKELGTDTMAIINVSVASLRGTPRHSSELVTQALLGTPLKILKEQNGWCFVQTPDKYVAWANTSSIERVDVNQFDEWKNSRKVIFLETSGYSIDTTETKRVSDLVAGNILVLEREDDKYWSVSYPDGRHAFINKGEASQFTQWVSTIEFSKQSIRATAIGLIGVPYMWGGTSTKALDCSGFTRTVFLLHGLMLPRDASQQVNVGKLVDKQKDFSRLEVGDLLFFGNKNEDLTERVVHVGLWLGENEFIHASGDVHISSMDSASEIFDHYNFKRYLRTKRIIDTDEVPHLGINQFFKKIPQ